MSRMPLVPQGRPTRARCSVGVELGGNGRGQDGRWHRSKIRSMSGNSAGSTLSRFSASRTRPSGIRPPSPHASSRFSLHPVDATRSMIVARSNSAKTPVAAPACGPWRWRCRWVIDAGNRHEARTVAYLRYRKPLLLLVRQCSVTNVLGWAFCCLAPGVSQAGIGKLSEDRRTPDVSLRST